MKGLIMQREREREDRHNGFHLSPEVNSFCFLLIIFSLLLSCLPRRKIAAPPHFPWHWRQINFLQASYAQGKPV